jgi:hypothetical protein
MSNFDPTITALVETFTSQLVSAVEAAAAQHIQAALAGAFGIPQKRGPGRPPKNAVTPLDPVVSLAAGSTRKKPPKQFCPVPGCRNVAAPVFGMVCKEHRKVAKSKIKKYRAERRTSKGGSPASAVTAKPRKASKASPSVARARKLQGQYLGALRSLSGADRSKVKQVAAEKGVADAVKLALSLKKSGK